MQRWKPIDSLVPFMFHLKEASCSLLLVSALGSTLAVQTPGQRGTIGAAHPQLTSGADSNAIGNQASSDRERALQMLDPLVEATNDLDSDLTKVHLQMRIADILWEYDESRARSRFERALTAADSIKAGPGALPNENANLRSQYRGSVLDAIKRRDPMWAKKLALDYWDRTKKQEPDMWTLMLLIDVDTQYATQIIRREIDGNSAAWLEMYLRKLRGTDPLQADDLFTHALSAAEQRSNRLFDDFRKLFNYVFPSKTGNYTGFDLRTDTSPVKPELIARFLDFGYKALIREANLIEQESRKDKQIGERSGVGYMELQLLLPFFDHYTPDSAAKIRTRWDEVIFSLRGGKEHIRQSKLLFSPMTTHEALRNAEQAKDQIEKQLLYTRAAKLAANEGDFDQALSILKRATDAEMRSDLDRQIRVHAAEAAIARGDVDAAYRYAKGVEDLRERTELLCGIVRLLQQKKDSVRATQVLNEVLESAQKAENNWLKPGAMLKIASAATLLDPARGFEVMNQALEVINSTKDFAQNVDDFDQNLLLLALTNFDRALLLTEKLNSKESRLIARTAVCRGILSKK
jgi:hypothetical protein